MNITPQSSLYSHLHATNHVKPFSLNSTLLQWRRSPLPASSHLAKAEASIADGKRILFRFGKAAFSFKFLPFKVPYPVPFRLLGDEAKGWLDTTYLLNTGNFRISRGNKGTTFVLQKETEPRQQQLSAISADSGVREAIDKLISTSRSTGTSELELSEGDWKMIWSSQVKVRFYHRLDNCLVYSKNLKIFSSYNGIGWKQIAGWKMLRMVSWSHKKTGTNLYDATMDDAAILFGQYGLPVELRSKFNLGLL